MIQHDTQPQTITIVLSIHKRPHEYENQIQCILNQTKKIDHIMTWCSNINHIINKYQTQIQYGITNVPGVYGRFTFSLNADTDFIYIMDDDIFPAPKYIERCINNYHTYGGCIISPCGVVFNNTPPNMTNIHRHGWITYPQSETQDHEVHYGQHGWFIHRNMLPTIYKELPKTTYSKHAGEDMHISHMITKHTNMKTIVLKHDTTDLDSYSNDPRNHAFMLGNDGNGIATQQGLEHMDQIAKDKTKDGWLTT